MKYAVFSLMLFVGVPYMTHLAATSEKARGWLVSLLVFSTAVSRSTKINFVSMETYRGPDRGFEFNLTDLVTWALILAMFIRPPQRIMWWPRNSGWLLLLYLIAIISAVTAPEMLYAAFSLLKWARGYVVFWCVANYAAAGWAGMPVWRGFILNGAYTSMVGLQQKFVGHVYRVPGPFDHSNTVPLFLNQFIPIILVWGLADRRLKGWEAGASVLVVLAMIATSQATFSRLGMLLSAAAFLLGLVVVNARAGGPRVRGATWVAAVLLVIGGALAAASIAQRMKDAPESSEQARAEFNQAAKLMADDNLFGVGVNNYPAVLTKESRYNRFISVMEDEEQAGVCHHIYNLTAAELGKPGLVVFVIILAGFLWVAVFPGGKRASLEGLGLTAIAIGAITLHISGFAEWVFRITPVTFTYAICSGLAVGWAERVRGQGRGRGRPAPEEDDAPNAGLIGGGDTPS